MNQTCASRLQLPAVPGSALKFPACGVSGVRVIAEEPTTASVRVPLQISATSCNPAWCCGLRPGLKRFALILLMLTAVDEIADKAAATRRI